MSMLISSSTNMYMLVYWRNRQRTAQQSLKFEFQMDF